MQRMAVDIARLHYKGASGVNRGWRRSRLGGGSGSHFYAWWAPAGSAPLKRSHGFRGSSPKRFSCATSATTTITRLCRRAIPANDYLPMSVPDLRSGEYAPAPWTQPQLRFARSRGPRKDAQRTSGIGQDNGSPARGRRIAGRTRLVPDIFAGISRLWRAIISTVSALTPGPLPCRHIPTGCSRWRGAGQARVV